MSTFTDALNKPLPSKMNAGGVIQESANLDDLLNDDTQEKCGQEGCEGQERCGDEGCNGSCAEDSDPTIDIPSVDDEDDDIDSDDVSDISNSDDGFDPDDMSDDELAALDAELSDDAIDSVIDDEKPDEVSLSPEEEIKADDMMKMAATTMLVNDELNAEEKAQFVESSANVAIDEGFMTESDINEMINDLGLVTEGKYNNRMIIRLDAASKKKQLYALAVNVSAAAKHDPDYIKLKKVMKMRKILRAKLERKYHGEATKRMKIYFNRLKKSKSAPLSKIGNKYNK